MAAERLKIRVGSDDGVQVAPESTAPEARVESGRLVVAVGQVYDPVPGPAAEVIANTSTPVETLEGSFMAVKIDDADRVAVTTDHVASRKAYIGRTRGDVYITNRLADMPLDRFALDPAGIGAFLACNGVHGGLTPYEGIRALPPATTATFSGGEVTTTRHWTHHPQPKSMDWDDTTRALDEAYAAAVERRVRARSGDGPVMVSLSGGHDSKGVLSYLREFLPATDIVGMSYIYQRTGGLNDATAGAAIAEYHGVDHEVVTGYREDFMANLQDNAVHGDATAHYCDDADVWRSLADRPSKPSLVFCGDRRNHWYSSVMRDMDGDAVLGFVNVHSAEVINWFLETLPASAAGPIRDAWNEHYRLLRSALAKDRDPISGAMVASVEERVGYTLGLWRERFTSRVAPTANPLLDRSVLDLMARTPLEWHDADRGSIHRHVIETRFPDLFAAVPSVFGGWNVPGWDNELKRNADAIRNLVATTPSRLDELIPPSFVLDLLDRVEARATSIQHSTHGFSWRVRRLARRSAWARRLNQRRNRMTRIRGQQAVRPDQLLLRLLTLRQAMALQPAQR